MHNKIASWGYLYYFDIPKRARRYNHDQVIMVDRLFQFEFMD